MWKVLMLRMTLLSLENNKMKKLWCVLCVALVGCGDGVSSFSSAGSSIDLSGMSSQEDSSSLSEAGSSSLNIIQKKNLILDFCERIQKMEGSVQSNAIEAATVNFYLSDSAPLAMSTSEVSTLTRYDSDQGQIVVKDGTLAFINDDLTVESEYPFETQIFYDDQYFYKITDFSTDSSSNSIEKIVFREENIDATLNIGFPYLEVQNFLYMANALFSESIVVEFEGIDQVVDNGVWNYEYGITSMSSGVPTQRIHYKNEVHLENGIITSVVQEYENDLYAGGIKANWTETYTEMTYAQGERLKFSGTRFDPQNYQ